MGGWWGGGMVVCGAFMEVTVSYHKEDWVSGLGCQIGEDRLTYGTRLVSDMGG